MGNAITGLLNNFKAETNNYTLPYNSLISDYGMTNAATFSFNLVAYAQSEQTVKIDKKTGVTPSVTEPKVVAEFEIISASDSYTANHAHQYGAGALAQYADTASQAVKYGLKAKTLLPYMNSAIKLASKGQAGIPTEWNTYTAFDVMSSYQGSTPPPITVDFNLITHGNPIADVVFPAMYLTYLSYPNANDSKTDEITDLMKKGLELAKNSSLTNVISDLAGVAEVDLSGDKAEQAKKTITDIEAKAKGIASTAVKIVDNATKDKWRALVGDSPPWWAITTSNGIASLAHASLEGVDVTYHGPWIDVPSKSSIDAILAGAQAFANTGTFGLDPTKVFTDDAVGQVKDFFFRDTTAKNGWPSSATVSLRFKSNYSSHFAQDLFSAYGDSTNVFQL